MSRTIAGLTRFLLGADLEDEDLLIVRRADGDYKMYCSELRAALAEFFPELNEDGQIVGPIILSEYANAAAAGTPTNGTLVVVADELRLGDGSTQGGVSVANGHLMDTPSISGTTPSVALDTRTQRAFLYPQSNATQVTITNDAALPVGYELVIVCENPSITINFTDFGAAGIPSAGVITFLKTDSLWLVTATADLSGG